DRDVIWGNPVSEEIRKYPTLMSYDWPDYGEWPRAINMGVLMSRAKSPFLYTFLDTF
ncbi:glycosyltransferase sugar-binding region containing DXD motif-containing protein, partial [Biomphalaria glabrata]